MAIIKVFTEKSYEDGTIEPDWFAWAEADLVDTFEVKGYTFEVYRLTDTQICKETKVLPMQITYNRLHVNPLEDMELGEFEYEMEIKIFKERAEAAKDIQDSLNKWIARAEACPERISELD